MYDINYVTIKALWKVNEIWEFGMNELAKCPEEKEEFIIKKLSQCNKLRNDFYNILRNKDLQSDLNPNRLLYQFRKLLREE